MSAFSSPTWPLASAIWVDRFLPSSPIGQDCRYQRRQTRAPLSQRDCTQRWRDPIGRITMVWERPRRPVLMPNFGDRLVVTQDGTQIRPASVLMARMRSQPRRAVLNFEVRTSTTAASSRSPAADGRRPPCATCCCPHASAGNASTLARSAGRPSGRPSSPRVRQRGYAACSPTPSVGPTASRAATCWPGLCGLRHVRHDDGLASSRGRQGPVRLRSRSCHEWLRRHLRSR